VYVYDGNILLRLRIRVQDHLVLRKSLCSARWKFRQKCYRSTKTKYQNTIQNPYLPRPPQPATAPMKRLYRK
jgi:hypothetical protein